MEYLEYYKEMKDTIAEIGELKAEIWYKSEIPYSDIVLDLFDDITNDIEDDKFNIGITLYKTYSLLSVFDPAKKDDIEVLEQLKEKLERLNKAVL